MPDPPRCLSNRPLTPVFARCSQPISEQQVKELCLKAREILVEEANVQWIDSPVTVSPNGASRPGPARLKRLAIPDMR